MCVCDEGRVCVISFSAKFLDIFKKKKIKLNQTKLIWTKLKAKPNPKPQSQIQPKKTKSRNQKQKQEQQLKLLTFWGYQAFTIRN